MDRVKLERLGVIPSKTKKHNNKKLFFQQVEPYIDCNLSVKFSVYQVHNQSVLVFAFLLLHNGLNR